jgi:hypothetical protein
MLRGRFDTTLTHELDGDVLVATSIDGGQTQQHDFCLPSRRSPRPSSTSCPRTRSEPLSPKTSFCESTASP